jgi:DNA-binding NtrC family response regulator
VPPLRERREAIPALAREFLRRAAVRFDKDLVGIAPDAMRVLIDYSWPGNVRELEHAVERAAILAPGPRITAAVLPPELRPGADAAPAAPGLDVRAHERALIEKALAQYGNRRRAAEALHMSPVTLWRRMKRYGIGAQPAPSTGTPSRRP